MDNETSIQDAQASEAEIAGRSLPKGAPFRPAVTKDEHVAVAVPDSSDRAGVFRQLVGDDSDIAGLVAYSIYKQNKLDWLTAFEQAKARVPNADELASYIIGEGTPRRLATYRHLAEATLAGNGPEIGGSPTQQGARSTGRRGGGADKSALTPGMLALYALVAGLFLVGFLLAAHYTMTSR